MMQMPENLYNWLLQNQNLVKYLQFDANKEEGVQDIRNERLLIISSLVNFNNLNYPSVMPKSPTLPKIASKYLPAKIRDQSRMNKFLTSYKYKIQMKHFKKYLSLLHKLIDFFQDEDLLPTYIKCIFKETLFYCDALSPDERIKYIDKFIERNSNIPLKIKKSIRKEKMAHRINNIVEKCSMTFNEKTCFFPLNSLQEEFEVLLFSKQHEISNEIRSFIYTFTNLNHDEFIENLNKIFEHLLLFLEAYQQNHISILSILFYRAMFSLAYSKYPQYFSHLDVKLNNEKYTKLRNIITIKDISPPIKYLQKGNPSIIIKPDCKVIEIFKQYPAFQNVGQHLNHVLFYTNPFDALYEITFSLSELKKFVAIHKDDKDQGNFIAFETLFTLFFGSSLLSDIIDISEEYEFLRDFTLENKISSSFQYSLMTLEALNKQMGIFASQLIK